VRAANAEEDAARRDIESIIRTRNRDEWYDVLVKADVCVGKVYGPQELVSDAQVTHREMIVEIDHPRFGKVRQFGVAIKLSETPGTVRSAAPISGEHTEQVLSTLGLSRKEIAGRASALLSNVTDASDGARSRPPRHRGSPGCIIRPSGSLCVTS